MDSENYSCPKINTGIILVYTLLINHIHPGERMRFLILATLLLGFATPVVSELSVLTANLAVKEGVHFLKNEERPYTGYATTYFENGQMKQREKFLDGIKHGKEMSWHESGALKSLVVYRSGKPQAYGSSWYPNPNTVKQKQPGFLSCSELSRDNASFAALCGTMSKTKPTYIEFEK